MGAFGFTPEEKSAVERYLGGGYTRDEREGAIMGQGSADPYMKEALSRRALGNNEQQAVLAGIPVGPSAADVRLRHGLDRVVQMQAAAAASARGGAGPGLALAGGMGAGRYAGQDVTSRASAMGAQERAMAIRQAHAMEQMEAQRAMETQKTALSLYEQRELDKQASERAKWAGIGAGMSFLGKMVGMGGA